MRLNLTARLLALHLAGLALPRIAGGEPTEAERAAQTPDKPASPSFDDLIASAYEKGKAAGIATAAPTQTFRSPDPTNVSDQVYHEFKMEHGGREPRPDEVILLAARTRQAAVPQNPYGLALKSR